MKRQKLEVSRLPRGDFEQTWQVMEEATHNKAKAQIPGMVVGVWKFGSPQCQVGAIGVRKIFPNSSQDGRNGGFSVTPNTYFDLSSVSKVMATTALTAVLVERGWLDWDTPTGLPGVRVRHLLSHTSGLPAWAPLFKDLQTAFNPISLEKVSVRERKSKMRELVEKVRPDSMPSEKVLYSDIGFLRLGFLLEDLCGMDLDEAVEKWVWQPMGVEGAKYIRTTKDPKYTQSYTQDFEVASTEQCGFRGCIVEGVVHDENTYAMGGVGGHSGVFGRAQDVLTYAAGVIQSGWVSDKTLSEMFTREKVPVGCERALGWDTPSLSGSMAGNLFSPRTFGHWGFTGTSLWIDFEKRVAITVLTNRVHPTRENATIREVRPRLHDAILTDLFPG